MGIEVKEIINCLHTQIKYGDFCKIDYALTENKAICKYHSNTMKDISVREKFMQHVFIVGAKGFTYGGYETFLDKLTEYHQNNEIIKYHIACKANGPGMTDETKLAGAKRISDSE